MRKAKILAPIFLLSLLLVFGVTASADVRYETELIGPKLDVDLDQVSSAAEYVIFDNRIIGTDGLDGPSNNVTGEVFTVDITQKSHTDGTSFINFIRERSKKVAGTSVTIDQWLKGNSYASNEFIATHKQNGWGGTGLNLDLYQKINAGWAEFINTVNTSGRAKSIVFSNETWEGRVAWQWADVDGDGDSDPNAGNATGVPAHYQIGFTQSLDVDSSGKAVDQTEQKFIYGPQTMRQQFIVPYDYDSGQPYSAISMEQFGFLNSKNLPAVHAQGGKAYMSQSGTVEFKNLISGSSDFVVLLGNYKTGSSDVAEIGVPEGGLLDFDKSVQEF